MGGIGAQNYMAIRLRIEAGLRECGPMTTPEILHRLKHAYAEAAIRTALRFLDDDGLVRRPTQKQRWELVPREAGR
jgi:hypothetical protein